MLPLLRRCIRVVASRQALSLMDGTILAAIARFPDRERAVAELAARDEEFLVLCTDLFDAEEALVRWEQTASPLSAIRCVEYRDLIRDLVAEVEAALKHAQG